MQSTHFACQIDSKREIVNSLKDQVGRSIHVIDCEGKASSANTRATELEELAAKVAPVLLGVSIFRETPYGTTHSFLIFSA